MTQRYRGTCSVWARNHYTPRPGYMVTVKPRAQVTEPEPEPPVYSTDVSTLAQRELNDALARRLGLSV